MDPEGRFRRLALPMAGNVVQGVVWGVFVTVLLPSYADLHGHLDRYGMVVASNALAMAICYAPGGRLSDTMGRTRVITGGWAIMSAAPFLLVTRTDFPSMVAAAVVLGAGMGISGSAFHSYIADISMRKRLSSNYGALSASSLACAAVVTMGMGRWLERFTTPSQGMDMGMTLMGALMVAGTLVSLGFRDVGVLTRPPVFRIRALSSVFHGEEWKVVRSMVLLQSVTGAGAALTVQFYVPFFIDRFGVDRGTLFVLSAAGLGILAVATLVSGAAGDRTDKLRFVLVSNAVAVPMAFGIILSPEFPPAGLFYIGRMALANMIWPVWTAFFMMHLRSEVRGLANGLAGAAWNIVYVPCSFIAWDVMKLTGGWTIPLASIAYLCVTSYLAWHLRDLTMEGAGSQEETAGTMGIGRGDADGRDSGKAVLAVPGGIVPGLYRGGK